MLKKILTAYPDLFARDGRFFTSGHDVTEPIEVLLQAIDAEPEREQELIEQAPERLAIWIDPEAYARRYLRRPALA